MSILTVVWHTSVHSPILLTHTPVVGVATLCGPWICRCVIVTVFNRCESFCARVISQGAQAGITVLPAITPMPPFTS